MHNISLFINLPDGKPSRTVCSLLSNCSTIFSYVVVTLPRLLGAGSRYWSGETERARQEWEKSQIQMLETRPAPACLLVASVSPHWIYRSVLR